MKSVIRLLPFLCLALLLVGASVANAGPRTFPNYGEVEYEHSIITIPLILEGETQPAEVLKLDAFMRLNRGVPVRNGLGYRQIEFSIDAWELYGYSKVLDGYITFKVADAVKPKSLVVSLQKDRDYPAMIVYNAIYDVYLNDVKIIDKQAGVAFATGVMEIPPRNITVAFHKPFSLSAARKADTRLDAKLGDVVPSVEFDAGTCEDMSQITREQFNSGLREAARYRERPMAKSNQKPSTKPADAMGAGRSNKTGSNN
ncbi:MAG: hypothetical protein ACLGI9_01130 [Thermoanaerobaculia bacterium]